MTLPLLGYGAYIGTGEESTWGTAVTRTAWITAAALNIRRTIVTEDLDHLTGLATGPYPRESFQSREDVTGNVEFYAEYANKVFAHFLKHGIGQVNTTGSGPYTHTFTPTATLPTGLTVEQGNASNYEVFEGCKVATWEFSIAAGQTARFSASVIGQTSGGFNQPNSSPPTVPGHTYIAHHGHAGSATINGNTYTLRSFRIRGDNALARRDALGSQATDEPFSTGPRRFSASMELYATNEVLIGDYYSRNQADASITFSNSPRSLAFTLRNAIITRCELNQNQPGGSILTLELQGYYNGTNNGISVALVNANSSAV